MRARQVFAASSRPTVRCGRGFVFVFPPGYLASTFFFLRFSMHVVELVPVIGPATSSPTREEIWPASSTHPAQKDDNSPVTNAHWCVGVLIDAHWLQATGASGSMWSALASDLKILQMAVVGPSGRKWPDSLNVFDTVWRERQVSYRTPRRPHPFPFPISPP